MLIISITINAILLWPLIRKYFAIIENHRYIKLLDTTEIYFPNYTDISYLTSNIDESCIPCDGANYKVNHSFIKQTTAIKWLFDNGDVDYLKLQIIKHKNPVVKLYLYSICRKKTNSIHPDVLEYLLKDTSKVNFNGQIVDFYWESKFYCSEISILLALGNINGFLGFTPYVSIRDEEKKELVDKLIKSCHYTKALLEEYELRQ